jgi:NDP-sugar pyrophosphorylase family protein
LSELAGVVLAAGLGTRLRPLTNVLPKALCPVNNVALVDLALDHVGRLTTDVAVNVHAHREPMERHFAARPAVHLSIEEPEPLGTAGALGRLRDWIDGRPVVVHNADAWHTADLQSQLVEGWDGERLRLLVVSPPRAADGDFGQWWYAGVALLPWHAVAPLEPEPTGLYEVSWRDAYEEGRVELVAHEGTWFDTGTPRTYLAANLAASGGCSVIAPDATVEATATVERSVVWSGARVEAGERLVNQIRARGGLTVDGAA